MSNTTGDVIERNTDKSMVVSSDLANFRIVIQSDLSKNNGDLLAFKQPDWIFFMGISCG